MPPPLAAGTADFRRARWGLFIGGFAIFAMFYGPQPLLSLFGQEFRLTPSQASGVMSATAAAIALGLIPAGLLAQRFGPKPVMVAAMVASGLCSVLCAVAPDYPSLLACRALLGLCLAGLPGTASAYLAEELDPSALGQAMGLFIAGNAFGSMSSRLVCGVLADLLSWRVAFAGLGAMGLLAALAFWRCLPASRRHRPRPWELRVIGGDLRSLLREPGLLPLFTMAFLSMGSFVSFFNYLGFRLGQAPFEMSHSTIGAIFLLYVIGMFSSPWAGRMADRRGSSQVIAWMLALSLLGLALTVVDTLPLLILGVACVTFAFFGTQAVSNAWVGRLAQRSKALAAAGYLTAYYVGASSMGWLGGHAWSAAAWPGVMAFCSVLWLGCVLMAWRLKRSAAVQAASSPAADRRFNRAAMPATSPAAAPRCAPGAVQPGLGDPSLPASRVP
jgi:YNFM family putative membrane transporter